jgi:uncharacterized LabA/DUF88 family protein
MKLAAFIDGPNFYATGKALGIQMDFKRLLSWLRADGDQLIRAFYYTAILDTKEVDPIRPLIDYLDYNGYAVVKKFAKEFEVDGHRKIKGNMDIELAIDMMEIADKVDHIVLFSGDGDFRRLVEAVQRKGVTVTVVSSLQSTPAMIADELRRQADLFVELSDIVQHVQKSEPSIARVVR